METRKIRRLHLKREGEVMKRVAVFSGESIENAKRRRALQPFSGPLDLKSRLFFDRILSVRKAREIIFIGKASAKN